MGFLRLRSRSQWRFEMLMFVRTISSEPQNIFLSNLVWLCSIISQSTVQKNWFTVFNVKVTVRTYIIIFWLFLLYLLNCWLVCNQTWFDSTASYTGESCWKMGLLRSRSRSQQRFKMWVNVCPDDIFWITEHFVTKFGMVMQHHEPECHAGKKFLLLLLSSRSRWQQGLIWSKYDSFYYIFWIVDSLATKLDLLIHNHKPECPVKEGWLLHSGSGSQWRVKMLMDV